MFGWLSILIIVLANLLLGWLILGHFAGQGSSAYLSYLDEALVCFTLGMTVNGWVALVLAELDLFSTLRVATIWMLLSLVLGISLSRRGVKPAVASANSPAVVMAVPSPIPGWLEYPFLGIWLLAACWLFFRPHEFIIGAADAGVYVNLAAEISQNGGILIQDSLLEVLDPALFPAFLRPIQNPVAPYYILPAFFVIGEPAGEITPQFYPLHPVWQAVAHGLGGIHAELLLTGLWALCGSLAVYLMMRRLAGWEIAAMALSGLSISAPQVWFARYPTTEPLAQFLLWIGLWSLSRWLGHSKPLADREPPALWALLSGLTLGQLFLVRIDTLFILPILGILGLWLWGQGRRDRSNGWFFIPLALMVAHSLIHALWQSRPYAFELFGFGMNLLVRSPGLIVLVLGLLALVLWAAARFRGRLRRLVVIRRQALLILIVTIISLAVYGWFIRPYNTITAIYDDPYSTLPIPLPNHENLLRLGWYLTPLGVWLGIAGICLLLWHINRQTAPMLAIGLFFSILYLWNVRANPHHIYVMRRYVPAVLPLFIVSAAYAIGWLTTFRKWPVSGFAVVLAMTWLGGLAWSARGFVSQVDYQGLTNQLEAMNTQLVPDSVLLFNDQLPIGQGDLWGTTMRFLFRHHVFTLRDPSQLNQEELDDVIHQWQARGHQVYWIDVPGGQSQLRPSGQIQLLQSYNIQSTNMEITYEHRPAALVAFGLTGDINRLQSR